MLTVGHHKPAQPPILEPAQALVKHSTAHCNETKERKLAGGRPVRRHSHSVVVEHELDPGSPAAAPASSIHYSNLPPFLLHSIERRKCSIKLNAVTQPVTEEQEARMVGNVCSSQSRYNCLIQLCWRFITTSALWCDPLTRPGTTNYAHKYISVGFEVVKVHLRIWKVFNLL